MKRAKQNLSFYSLHTWEMGELIPIGVQEVLPGDTFRMSTSALVRSSPLTSPVMHPVRFGMHHWFVSNRLVWDEWEDFITKKNPDLTVPTITVAGADDQDLLDHIGVGIADDWVINALPIRAYNLIWNHAYRDQDIDAENDLDKVTLSRVRYEKDYYTTARVDAEAAGSVSVPIESLIEGIGVSNTKASEGASGPFKTSGGTGKTWKDGRGWIGTDLRVEADVTNGDIPYIRAEGGMDIEAWRRAMGTKRFLEHRNMFGSRYPDYLRYLGISPSDARFQEPEYLGGGRQSIAWSEVLATSEGNNTLLGDMGGHGVAAMRSRPFTRFFPEHGYIISLAYVRPKNIYMNSIHKHWLRSKADDFWQKEYEIFGPQEVYKYEINSAETGNEVFGYQQRHQEYRFNPSYVAGGFRDGTQEDWHFARKFEQTPSLNSAFLECNPPERPYAYPAGDHLFGMFSHRSVARRLVSKYART